MVTFNRNSDHKQSFPIPLARLKCRIQANKCRRALHQRDKLLQKISIAWNQLLESASEVLSVIPSSNGRRSLPSSHPDLPMVIISILNRCQLMRWMHETHLENPDPAANCNEYMLRTKESIERDLIMLRQLLDSTSQSKSSLRTIALADQLAVFVELLSKCVR